MGVNLPDLFGKAVQHISENSFRTGRLGRSEDDGSVTVIAPGIPHLVYVETGSGQTTGLTIALNMGVPRKAGIRVRMVKVARLWIVIGVDYASGVLGENDFNVAYHHHGAGSGLGDGVWGQWTPLGNGVSLTGRRTYHTVSGGLVHAFFDATWPPNSDGGEARILGLPFVCKMPPDAAGTVAFRYMAGAAPITGGVLNGTSYIELLSVASPPIPLTNAEMSERRVSGVAIYATSWPE